MTWSHMCNVSRVSLQLDSVSSGHALLPSPDRKDCLSSIRCRLSTGSSTGRELANMPWPANGVDEPVRAARTRRGGATTPPGTAGRPRCDPLGRQVEVLVGAHQPLDPAV